MKIFADCLLQKLNFIKNGVMQEEVILEKSKNSANPKYFKNCVRICRHIRGNDHGSTAYKMISCFRRVEKFDFLSEWQITYKDCKNEIQISQEEYTKLQNLPVQNPTLAMKQYAACVFLREGFLKDNILQEKVILEVAEDYTNADYLKTFVEQCKDIKESNQDLMAFKLFECLQKIKATQDKK